MRTVAGAGAPPAPAPPASASAAPALARLQRLHLLAAPPPPEPVRPWRLLVLGCLAVAALSLLGPNQPTYDPWAWIIWGRETLHLDLVTTSGPSWKPLPWLFTTPFALFGDAAPQLWLVVARAGGLLAFAMAYRLAARLAGPGAGLIAAVSLLLADEFVRNFALGNSEGLLVAVCLWAVERHLDHRRRDTFLLIFAAALLRPEVWPLWALYGLWMVAGAWRERLPRMEAALLGGTAVALALLWFVPEYLGSGDFLRAAARARQANPDSAAYAAVPFLEVFRRSYFVLSIPVYAGALLAVGGALVAWRREHGGRLRLALAAMATVLMIVVAAMTQVGFAGNLRYIALPASIVCVLAGVGWVDALRWTRARLGAVAAVVAALAILAVWGPWARGDWESVTVTWDQVRRDSVGDGDLRNAIAAAGGRAAVTRCRPVYTGPFHTTALAWNLRLHVDEVQIFPTPPGTIVAGRRSWYAHDPRFNPVARSRQWRVLRRCGRS
jgi:hypothetical protein